MLPVAFAASVKNEDHVDNSFAFAYDADTDEILAATSSKRYAFDDDVDFSVTVSEAEGELPLASRVRFRLLEREAVRYEGDIHFRIVNIAGDVIHEEQRDVAFTLRWREGRKSKAFVFPFDAPSGEYKVGVTFSR